MDFIKYKGDILAQVARMGNTISAYRILVSKSE
jgi:hypothetical protein